MAGARGAALAVGESVVRQHVFEHDPLVAVVVVTAVTVMVTVNGKW